MSALASLLAQVEDEHQAALEQVTARRDHLERQVVEHRDHLAGELRKLRGEHATLLRTYGEVVKAHDELRDEHARCGEGVVLEDDGTLPPHLVLVNLDLPGRMVTISSVPYTEDGEAEISTSHDGECGPACSPRTEDVPDEQSDAEHVAKARHARRTATCKCSLLTPVRPSGTRSTAATEG